LRQPSTKTTQNKRIMPTTKAEKIALAKKNSEAEKAKKKALRTGKSTVSAPTGGSAKKGPSAINQSKTKKK
jgi:hypothetical protein